MLSRITPALSLNLTSWFFPEPDSSSPAATTGSRGSSKIFRTDGPSASGCSVHQRHIAATATDLRREWIHRVQSALDNIDIPIGNKSLLHPVLRAQQDLDLMSQMHAGEHEKCYPHSLQQLINYLVGKITLPGNISVVQTLADLGLGLGVQLSVRNIEIPPRLFKQLLDNTNHETKLRILGNHAKLMMFKADPGFTEILEKYLPRRQLQEAARELMSELAKRAHPLTKLNPSLRFSDISAPYLIAAMFASPGIRPDKPQAPQNLTTALHSEFFTLQLCMLEVNVQRHEKLILEELKKLDDREREQLLVYAFILGQWELFKRLLSGTLPTILNQSFNNGGNILHVMVTALPNMDAHGNVHSYFCLDAYTPRYDQLFQYLPAEILANQRDNSGATPLSLLYRHRPRQLASMHISAADDSQLVKAHRSALIKLTASDHLIDCMQIHSDGNFPLNLNWFFEFLQLFKALLPSTIKAVRLRSEKYSFKHELKHKPLPTQLLQPVINYLAHHPDALRDEQQTLELLRLTHRLPVEYSAQVLQVVTPIMQKKLLEHLSATPDGRNTLFIERHCDVYYQDHYYPWHLIGLGIGAGCAPDPVTFYSEHFLNEVAAFDKKHPEESVPDISGLWEAEFINSRTFEIYGRSLAFHSTEVPQGYRRFKFRKQRHGATEDWHDFVREQPQLDFFRKHKDKLGLESALLKPRGIYRLPHALDKLKTCGLSDETLTSIAFEPDGSALLQVFDDEKNTSLYHHYPYETKRAGFCMQASFAGIRLFARDAGRLWQHNFQAPDTLSSFHNAADGRAWVPTPFFGMQSLPGTMGEWNAQDYPNIAPAPVGMRDWADIRSFVERTSCSFGMKRLYITTQCERQGELRIAELGKAFYGLVINWLRVRHDTDNLDYKNSEQMKQLQEELVTIATDLFGNAYNIKTEAMKAKIGQEFPAESLTRAALECGYWCDPKVRYVKHIKSGRFPHEVYPDHPNQSFDCRLNPDTKNLTCRGIWRSSGAKGPNLGIDAGTLPLVHLDSLFWFAIYTGWRLHEPYRSSQAGN